MFAGLYRKIVSYALLRSGLGSPTEIAVVREATGVCITLPTEVKYNYCNKYAVFLVMACTATRIIK